MTWLFNTKLHSSSKLVVIVSHVVCFNSPTTTCWNGLFNWQHVNKANKWKFFGWDQSLAWGIRDKIGWRGLTFKHYLNHPDLWPTTSPTYKPLDQKLTQTCICCEGQLIPFLLPLRCLTQPCQPSFSSSFGFLNWEAHQDEKKVWRAFHICP